MRRLADEKERRLQQRSKVIRRTQKKKSAATKGTTRKKGKAEEFPKPTAEQSKEARLKRKTFIDKRESGRRSKGNRKRIRTST